MTATDKLMIVATMLGGLALFLSGMSIMSDSLGSMAGGGLNTLINKATKNRMLAFLFGLGVTCVAQSASAITVLVVGLVNSGLIRLTGAIGMIIGANLGTTITAWLLALNAIDGQSLFMTILKPSTFSPFLAIIGVGMSMFCKSQKKKTIASALYGFAFMMIGMNLMSQAVAPLKEIPAIQDFLNSFTNPILGFLFACVFTLLIQSADAFIGIVQAFALSVGITFGMAIPLICGAQVGTCITALMSSMGTSRNARRTALMALYYNLLKTISFMAVFYLLDRFVDFAFLERYVGGIGVPFFHSFINICGIAVWLPLSNVIVRMAQRTIPMSEEEKQEKANRLSMLDENLLATPEIAIEQTDRAVTLLSETVGEAFITAIAVREDPKMVDQAHLLCERSRQYREQIDAYLLRISGVELGQKERAEAALLSAGSTAFGQMGKTAEKLLGMIRDIDNSQDKLTERDRRDIRILGQAIYEIIQLTIKGYNAKKLSLSRSIQYYTEEIMALGSLIKSRYMQRVHEEGSQRDAGALFTSLCYTEEQLIDYCDMIADALISYGRNCGEESRPEVIDNELMRKQIHEIFRDKFEARDSYCPNQEVAGE
ncbi:MAG: Na/Pi cotransporter family protein [Oscillospiraceae bacterium]|nr:Na/Pi cotransporter family protein [Oscillospiraceae bacterium]